MMMLSLRWHAWSLFGSSRWQLKKGGIVKYMMKI